MITSGDKVAMTEANDIAWNDFAILNNIPFALAQHSTITSIFISGGRVTKIGRKGEQKYMSRKSLLVDRTQKRKTRNKEGRFGGIKGGGIEARRV